mmetsp:Transcript_17951/g.32569  ORF Transcript_17951/g.32569 Transcript_17951/m.32569 type:complete len:710 (-) Transcript_17951:106-2235(-)
MARLRFIWRDVRSLLKLIIAGALVSCVVLQQFRLQADTEVLAEEARHLEALETQLAGLGRRLSDAGLPTDDDQPSTWLGHQLVKAPAGRGLSEKMWVHHRRLVMFSNVKAYDAADKNTGCVTADVSADDLSIDLSMNSCGVGGGIQCPPCFLVTSAGKKLQLTGCSSAKVSNSAQIGSDHPAGYDWLANAAFSITVINTDTVTPLEVDSGNSSNSFTVAAESSVVAFCYTGGSNHIYWPSLGGSAGTDMTGATPAPTPGPPPPTASLLFNPSPTEISAGPPPSDDPLFGDGAYSDHILQVFKPTSPDQPTGVLAVVQDDADGADVVQKTWTSGTNSVTSVGGVCTYFNRTAVFCGEKHGGGDGAQCFKINYVGGVSSSLTWAATAGVHFEAGKGMSSAWGGPVRYKVGSVMAGSSDQYSNLGYVIMCYRSNAGKCNVVDIDGDGTMTAGPISTVFTETLAQIRLIEMNLANQRVLACYSYSEASTERLSCAILSVATSGAKTVTRGAVNQIQTNQITSFNMVKCDGDKAVLCVGGKPDGANDEIKCYNLERSGTTITKGSDTTVAYSANMVWHGAFVRKDSGTYYSVWAMKKSGTAIGIDAVGCQRTASTIGCQYQNLSSLSTRSVSGMNAVKVFSTEYQTSGSHKGAFCMLYDYKLSCYGFKLSLVRRRLQMVDDHAHWSRRSTLGQDSSKMRQRLAFKMSQKPQDGR